MRGRPARARERLRKSLARQGVEVPAIVAAARPAIPGVVVRPKWREPRPAPRSTFRRAGRRVSSAISQSAIFLYERTCRTMMLTKLKAAAAALVFGAVAAGAFVSAQQPGGGAPSRQTPRRSRGRPQAVAAGRGNLIVDWIPADGQGGKRRSPSTPGGTASTCRGGAWSGTTGQTTGPSFVDLERGKFYKITAAGEAFMNEQTGPDADPFPGVVLLLPHRRRGLLRRADRSSWRRESRSRFGPRTSPPSAGGQLMAFFIGASRPAIPSTGAYPHHRGDRRTGQALSWSVRSSTGRTMIRT